MGRDEMLTVKHVVILRILFLVNVAERSEAGSAQQAGNAQALCALDGVCVGER